MRTPMKHVMKVLLLACAAFGLAFPAAGATPPSYDGETMKLFETLPVQEGGRVKPMDTIGQFALLKMNGSRTYRHNVIAPDGSEETLFKLGPGEWLLHCLVWPEAAKDYRHFLVADQQVLDVIGVEIEDRKRRDRYSYNELMAGRKELFDHAIKYQEKEEQDRTRIESMIVNLAQNVHEFERLIFYFDFARVDYPELDSEGLEIIFGDLEDLRFSDVLAKAASIQFLYTSLDRDMADNFPVEKREAEKEAVLRLMGFTENLGERAIHLAMFPGIGPTAEEKEYFTAGELIEPAFQSEEPIDEKLTALRRVEDMIAARAEPAEFKAHLREVHARLAGAAESRGEYSKIPLEVALYDWQPFTYSQVFYILTFVMVALLWMRPQSTWLYQGANWFIWVPTLILIGGITVRCIIRERPPVSTLYETILFITACVVATAWLMERMNKQRIALSVAAVMGAFGMFLANRYEAKEGTDTMPSLIAVLDTNFWLSTHVTTVTLGYAAGLLACGIGMVYVIMKALQLSGVKPFSKSLLADVTKMTYGTIAFGLVFSTVGTILGGLWANDSWGRFWGWDPKENGALMIVLWMLFMLHARMGGYLRQWGFNLAAIFGGAIVAFSWWGVNLLGIGLHSYGFTSGVLRALYMWYSVVGAFLVIGGAMAYYETRLKPQRGTAAKILDEEKDPESTRHISDATPAKADTFAK